MKGQDLAKDSEGHTPQNLVSCCSELHRACGDFCNLYLERGRQGRGGKGREGRKGGKERGRVEEREGERGRKRGRKGESGNMAACLAGSRWLHTDHCQSFSKLRLKFQISSAEEACTC